MRFEPLNKSVNNSVVVETICGFHSHLRVFEFLSHILSEISEVCLPDTKQWRS